MIFNEFNTEEAHIFCLDTLDDGKGIRNLRNFFYEIIVNFSQEIFLFYNIWGEFPFIYSEKQINSILAPSVYKYTKNVWMEQPFKDYKKNQRFLDLAIADKSNIYLIELKHSWNSKINEINTRTKNKWETAITQIDDINRKTIHDCFNYKDFNVFKISLMIMPTFLPAFESHKILSLNIRKYTQNIFDHFECYVAQKYKANFIGTVKINEPKKYIHEYDNGKQIYPYITFVAKILSV